MSATEKMIEAAEEAIYGRHERGFIMKPLINPIDMRKAINAALEASPTPNELALENAALKAALKKAPDIIATWAGIHKMKAEEYTARALRNLVYPEIKALCESVGACDPLSRHPERNDNE